MVPGRQIVLLDVENLVGVGRVTEGDIELLSVRLSNVLPINRNDIVIIGGDCKNAFCLDDLARRYGGCVVWGVGRDGADIALSTAFAEIPPSAWDCPYSPVTRLVIGSGDHHFAPIANSARSKGRQVLTISRWLSLSNNLARTADTCLTLQI